MASTTRTVLVTGAGSGIGRDVALRFLQEGDTVFLVGRKADALDTTRAAAGADAAARAIPQPGDVSSPADVARIFATVADMAGRIDIVFNNAGVNAPGPIGELSFESWSHVIGVNVTGAFLVAQAAFRMMKDQVPQGGRIINNGSVSAHAPRPNSVAYTTSKHAITGLTKCLSLDGRAHGIACGQIDIGNAATDMAAAIGRGVPQADGSVRPEPLMDVRSVTDSVLLMGSLPLDANIQFLTVVATAMPFVGRG